MPKRTIWFLLILLAAASLRLVELSDIPPGLTHDEADHGLDAWGVVNGIRPIYFTVGYGREPLFDYATAGLMTFLGPSFMAGRLTAAYLSLIMIAGTYAWVCKSFNEKTALLTAAGLAVSFWPVMTGRQALRSISLPALFVLAVLLYWLAIRQRSKWPGRERAAKDGLDPEERARFSFLSAARSPITHYLLSGLILGITFYTYFPARILWLLFPSLLLFLALFDRQRFNNVWRGTLLMLLVAGIIAAPLLLYLIGNPLVEARVIELSQPLRAVTEGNLGPLMGNMLEGSYLLFFRGDGQWRYNIPGQAFLPPVMALLFFVGLSIAIWRIMAGIKDRQQINRAVSAFFLLIWMLLGLSPALVTGAELSTTRIIGLQPVLYVFPALALTAALNIQMSPKWLAKGLAIILFCVLAFQTARNYFVVWANEPEVRVQYESALVSAINFLNENELDSAAISTTTPNRYHSPAVAQLMLKDREVAIGWFDGQSSLLVPQDNNGTLIFSGFAPLSPFLEKYFTEEPIGELPQRASDIDRPLFVYSANSDAISEEWRQQFSDDVEVALLPARFGTAADFLGYDIQTSAVKPGEILRLATLWRLNEPLESAVMFVHIVDQDGQILAQSDRLDAPGDYWREGDLLIQLHEIVLPDSMVPGSYGLLVGIYSSQDEERLPVQINGSPSDHLRLPPLVAGP